MKDKDQIHFRRHTPALLLGACLALGLSACGRPDGQMSDSEAGAAPKESATLGAAIDDTGITAKVKQRLASDARLLNATIDVHTNNGVVGLTGTAPDRDTKLAAEELTRSVENVAGVDNQIQAPSAVADAASKARQAVSAAGSEISDAGITTKVKAQLAADEQVKAGDLDVDTDNGIVRLTGIVPSPQARARAIEIARKTDGVKNVNAEALKVVEPS